MSFKDTLRQLVEGTPLEAPARAAWRAIKGAGPTAAPPPPPAEPVSLNALYDAQTEAILARVLERGSNCVDVGCHHGVIMDAMLRFAPEGTHFGFEPLPDLFAGLRAKYAAVPQVKLFELALSEEPGTSTFQHVVTNPGYSGLLRRRYDRPHEDVVQISVSLAKLDDVLPPDAMIRLIKVDVEGAELGVFRGGIETIRRCRPFIVFEHGLGAADFYGTRPEQVWDLLSGCGLRLALMKDWLESGGARTLTREAFAHEFESGSNYYFLAHP